MRTRLLINLLFRVYAGVSLRALLGHYGKSADVRVALNLG